MERTWNTGMRDQDGALRSAAECGGIIEDVQEFHDDAGGRREGNGTVLGKGRWSRPVSGFTEAPAS